jgi:tetratricopeptide (TPR) repeat protein
MKCHFKILLIALLALALACVFKTTVGRASTESQGQEADAQASEVAPEYSQEEYDSYDAAVKEPDSLKRGKMLMQFIDKYPKSKLMPHIDAAYKTLLFDCSTAKKFAELEILGEQWLKLHPNDIDTLYYIADAAEKLGHDEKCIQCLLEIYKMQPTGDLAKTITQFYEIKDTPKFIEWAGTIFKYPEYDSDFNLRYKLVKIYWDSKDFAQATKYAQETLKSISLVRDPSADMSKGIGDIRWACHDVIGMNLAKQNKFAEAIASFEQALKVKKYGDGYYQVGWCLYKENEIDNAMIWYAKTELWCKEAGNQCGDTASKAKRELERIYRLLHNDKLTGIEKIYEKAKGQADTAQITNRELGNAPE